MKPTFLYGTITGISALALAVPLLAQVSNAASSAASSTDIDDLPAPSQACVHALVAADDAFLARIDAMTAAQKAATQAHRNALEAAAAIADETQRKAAVQKANADMRAAMEAARPAKSDDDTVMEALKTECGDSLRGLGMGHGFGPMMKIMHGRGHGPEMLSEKLGMTADELNTALDSGKTLEQIAEEKGIALPARPMLRLRGGDIFLEKLGEEDVVSSSSAATTQQ